MILSPLFIVSFYVTMRPKSTVERKSVYSLLYSLFNNTRASCVCPINIVLVRVQLQHGRVEALLLLTGPALILYEVGRDLFL